MSNVFNNANKGYMSQSKKWQIIALIIILIAIVLVAYSLIRFFIDQYNYEKGHQAYYRSDCAVAIPHYDNILNGRRFIDLGGVYAPAQQEKIECSRFLEAIQKQQIQEYDAALFAYMIFINDFRASRLAGNVRNRILFLFETASHSSLASLETCPNISFLLDENLIPKQEDNLPPFYVACGQVYDTANMRQEAYAMYETYLKQYPNHALAQTAEANLLSNPTACEEISSLKSNSVISSRPNFMPKLYQSCAQIYAEANNPQAVYDMHMALLNEYPQHPLAAEAETYVLSSSIACENINSLQTNDVISVREDFLPRLYYNCGQAYESDGNWAEAIKMYENFLATYPGHSLSNDVEAALARSIVAQANKTSAGELPPPQQSGTSGSTNARIVIQNHSPEKMRIVFSGPDVNIEELEPCVTCKKYSNPIQICPNEGPIGTYTMQPGKYDIVVESISNFSVTPWTGNWELTSGIEYSHCFYIIIQ